ncbi:Ubiquitin domain-containing protein ubfd1 [Desmophyllum pertusum]|uniref:Ubiquitin domain-containing protein ubfd1 n=1 Tax=Desmophyllum pertusum TaxID=174260 RepID=A0A9W9ZJB8_9CNID|nr:Ubiquitin domain-containing protein ubfd1 [Desmophyllum pertusum]
MAEEEGSVVDAEDKLEAEPDLTSRESIESDPCRPKCCLKNADVENETEDTNEKSKEDFSVEEKEKDETEEEQATSSRESASFRVVWNKKNYEVTFPVDETADSLKQHIENLTGLPVSMQKLMYKGLVKDGSKTLRELHVTNGVKMMVVGSTINDVMKVTPPPPGALKEEKTTSAASKDPLCKQKMHKKVLDKGKPDDVMPGIKNKKEKLPNVPIAGMYNKFGGKVRLTFKLELDQIWIGTKSTRIDEPRIGANANKERTEKIPMGSIKNVVSEPIEEHDGYHILAIQLGPTEASRYWIYWVPAQYVDAIKDTILGKWQPF